MKNNKHLINVIQTASYMMLLSQSAMEDEYVPKINKKYHKQYWNKTMSYLKSEVKKLKRYK